MKYLFQVFGGPYYGAQVCHVHYELKRLPSGEIGVIIVKKFDVENTGDSYNSSTAGFELASIGAEPLSPANYGTPTREVRDLPAKKCVRESV